MDMMRDMSVFLFVELDQLGIKEQLERIFKWGHYLSEAIMRVRKE